MDFNYTDEQNALRDTLSRYIAKDYPFEARRALAKSAEGFSRDHWKQFADLGLLALPFPEEFGGLSGNAVDTMLVMEAFGRGLVLEPYLATVVVAGHLIRDAGSAAQKEAILSAIAGGERMLALAHYEREARYKVSLVNTAAKQDGAGWKLSGGKGVVLGGNAADTLLVTANTGKGLSLFLVDAKSAGVAVRSYMTQDGGRAAEIALDNVAVGKDALVGPEGSALPLVERALDYGIAALCAEAVGIMAALDEATLEYLKTRKQFGQPIGRFQALQHRMVDMVIATEQARSMAMMAAVKADSPDAAERRRAISAAKTYIGQQARFVGQQAVQLHGGMGVVDELNVSHYFKRLTMIELTFGNTDHHLGLFSDTLLAA
ncbi:MAG: acyl-CoA dehydrogenase family protein [Rhodocyclaceae bacterium]|jgi:alkylation response protein AidB-like acyl-CoA dehydrogenase|nr:Acyl-CoA dehydrogenase, short-chain specific [Rhodocyclaceae bacterium]MBZ0142306.1 acyl-CoA dehydrogenase family protein [Rhodocyclaceae bacterium]MCC6880266.1 acyl-CoA dehydrogenase family protein [Rhodocyclaceae bacterium]MCL4681858.1 acyl-CoA dehydrogenase family protein [Rhodocyclaceae bacterium]